MQLCIGMMHLGAGGEAGKEEGDTAKRIVFTYPMIKQTDMSDDMKAEVRRTRGRGEPQQMTYLTVLLILSR